MPFAHRIIRSEHFRLNLLLACQHASGIELMTELREQLDAYARTPWQAIDLVRSRCVMWRSSELTCSANSRRS